MTWGYREVLGPKNYTRKIDKILKYFELYQVFMNNFWVKMFEYSHNIYCLEEESTHFSFRVLITFVLEVSGHFGP